MGKSPGRSNQGNFIMKCKCCRIWEARGAKIFRRSLTVQFKYLGSVQTLAR